MIPPEGVGMLPESCVSTSTAGGRSDPSPVNRHSLLSPRIVIILDIPEPLARTYLETHAVKGPFVLLAVQPVFHQGRERLAPEVPRAFEQASIVNTQLACGMVDQAERHEDVAGVDRFVAEGQGGQAAGEVFAVLPSDRVLCGPVRERVEFVAQLFVDAGSNLVPPGRIGANVLADQ